MRIENIKPYPKNAKKHPQKQVQQVAASIKRFGFVQPIVIDKHNEVVIGHCRLEAAKLLGLTEVPTISVDKLTADEVKALRLADNKLNESDWNMELAIEDLMDLGPDKELFDLTGFDRDLLIGPDEKDDIVPENAPVIAKKGDLWALGEHRVLCGDSTDKDDVARLMGDKKADMVFTDPPYGMKLNTNYQDIHKGATTGKNQKQIIGDEIEFNPEFIIKDFYNVNEIFIWGFDYFSNILPKSGLFIWDKTLGDFKNRIGNEFEVCWSKQKHKKEIIRKLWVGYNGLQTEDTKKREHPTQKPVELCDYFIQKFSEEKNLIVDLFLGSGSTLIACEKTNRICYGMEIDPHYCDVIIKRWEDYTGKKAIKMSEISGK
jgi:DNA modification methylase